MSKNVKMLFALLATAAVMVGVSFAAGTQTLEIHTLDQLKNGSSDAAEFKLMNTLSLDKASQDSILSASEGEAVSFDLNNCVLSMDDANISSDTPLFHARNMTMKVTSGSIVMNKPLFGKKGAKSTDKVEATLTFKNVVYKNGAKSGDAGDAAFYGGEGYKITVKFESADISADRLRKGAGEGYTFHFDEKTVVTASLDGFVGSVLVDQMNAENGARFSDGSINNYLDDTQIAIKSGDYYRVQNAVGTVETSADLKEALSNDHLKVVKLSCDITTNGPLDVGQLIYGAGSKKTLDLSGHKLSFDQFGIPKCAFNIKDKVAFVVESGDIVVSDDYSVVSDDSVAMFRVDGGASYVGVTISGDVTLKAAKYFDWPEFGTTPNYENGKLDVYIREGAKFYFGNDEEKAAVEQFLREGQKFEDAGNGYWRVVPNVAPTPGGGSSSGCNAGFAALALLALAFIPTKKDK